ncbi:hypothetical protein NC652_027644 [Populus alba x Populus x berolinensis]|nr:hypothetical protein NC652_027644 [Populus alba x Populus x berolinensis]
MKISRECVLAREEKSGNGCGGIWTGLVAGFYAPWSHSQVSNHLTLLAESLPLMRMISLQCQHSVAVTGTDALYPGHFIIQIHWRPSIPWIKGFAKGGSKQDLERHSHWKSHGGQCGVIKVPSYLICRPKKWGFHYWFVFPVLVLDPPAILIESKRALEWFASEEARSVSAAYMPFFLISIASNSHATTRHLKDREACQADNQKVVSEYRKRGIEFLLQALNHPTYLEDLTGLTELKKSANSFKLDWDDETDDYNDDELFKLVIQDK